MQSNISFYPRSSKVEIRKDSLIESAPVGYEDFISLARGKNIYILSVNLEGIGLSKRLRSLGLNVKSFLDSRFSGSRHGIPVMHPESYFQSCDSSSDLLLICTKDREWKENFLHLAATSGFERYKTLFTPLDICRYFPTIEVEGKCNLVCKTCDMGLPSANKGRGHMGIDLFKDVLDKMVQEIPLMNSVALYTWGEPLLNPDLPKIIRECKRQGVASEVSTNLEYHKYLEEFLLAEPDQIVAPCAGVGERYERGRTGGTWDQYLKGLEKIAEYKNRFNLDYNVRIMYHLYKDNLDADLDYMKDLSKTFGFSLIPIVAHIFPGQVYQYAVNGVDIPDVMQEASANLIFPLEDQLQFARTKKSSKCHITNAFPTITWDGKVLHCCNMQKPTVGRSNYLDKPLNEFIEQRNSSPFCTKCMNEVVHKFFDVNISFEEFNGARNVIRL
ncbi:radical SAM protein [Polynucleobacter sp. MWH-P3-07-1]|uniref:radical SAM protein n=1 Tax=Polynucleobacter sp. MWH-P3-07-1 TaxID=1743173 RepID=UPI001BFECD89|nr:radical SAM protein [Polynucleobacter sp. MWH-P3-07-1]QWD83808.1 radical SAM protein [Polynucleobacter sp. MWH-P3-07-1]